MHMLIVAACLLRERWKKLSPTCDRLKVSFDPTTHK
jgi:hypothetical protein